MTSNSRVPQLLAPYIETLPKDTLVLLTSTLSNSVNWIIVRYLCGTFSNDTVKARRPAAPPPEEQGQETTSEAAQDVGIVLVSWLRDFEFWKNEARRAGGLDLATLSQSKKIAFVDGLSASSPPAAAPVQHKPAQLPVRPAPASSTLPQRGSPVPSRAPATATVPTSASSAPTRPAAPSPAHVPNSTELSRTRSVIETALASLSTSSAILILDAPELLLALQDPTSSSHPSISSAMISLIMSLRLHDRVHATVIATAADINALHIALPEGHMHTPLEIESQALLMGVAHMSDLLISARGLDTGAAGDVSGILRVTLGAAPQDEEEAKARQAWKEQELLYLVKNDGSAKVWERGAGVGVG